MLELKQDRRGRPHIRGHATTTIHLNCQRCLEPMPYEINACVNVVLLESGSSTIDWRNRSTARRQVPQQRTDQQHKTQQRTLLPARHAGAGAEALDEPESTDREKTNPETRETQIRLPQTAEAPETAKAQEIEEIEADFSRFSLHEFVEDELLLSLPNAPIHPHERCKPPAMAGTAVPDLAAGDTSSASARRRPSPFAVLEALKPETDSS
ncbi:MAG: DUF177 domain-containing protein [Gammaproteobacteria bacterium]